MRCSQVVPFDGSAAWEDLDDLHLIVGHQRQTSGAPRVFHQVALFAEQELEAALEPRLVY